MYKSFALVTTLMLSAISFGQENAPSIGIVIESGGRTVTFTKDVPKEDTGYDSPWHYAHAIRSGDYVHISGIIIGADPDDSLPISMDRFREHTENRFEVIQRFLATADANLEGLVKINTFHVLDGKNTTLTIDEQALAIAETKAKYAVEPHPAWTAVGTTGLFSPLGIVEIEMVVYAPLDGNEDGQRER